MAVETELSPFYLARIFKSEVGKSPHQYVLDRRIVRAKGLLRDTTIPIAVVAIALSGQHRFRHKNLTKPRRFLQATACRRNYPVHADLREKSMTANRDHRTDAEAIGGSDRTGRRTVPSSWNPCATGARSMSTVIASTM